MSRMMSLEQLCIEQESEIVRKDVIILELLTELSRFRELTEEEIRMMEDDNK